MKRSNKILSAMVIGSLLAGYSVFAETDLNVKYDDDSGSFITLSEDGTYIRNVKAGLVDANSQYAVNGSQLYSLKSDLNSLDTRVMTQEVHLSTIDTTLAEQTENIVNVKSTADMALYKVNRGYNFEINGVTAVNFDSSSNYMDFVSGDNVTIEASDYGSGIQEHKGLKFSVKADGKVEAGNTGLVTGGMVKEAINLATEGIATDVNVANKADKDLSNLSDGGKQVIATAVADTVSGKADTDASNINVSDWSKALGTTTIEENGTGLITSGALYTAINDMSSDVTDMLNEMSDQFVMSDASNVGKNFSGTDAEKQTNLNSWGKAIGTGVVEDSNGQLVTGGTVFTALSDYAKKDATGIDTVKWQEALGTGANEAGNTGLVTGDTLNKALAGFTGNAKTYSGSDTISVSDDGVIAVKASGKVESNNEGLVSGGTVYEAIKEATKNIASDATVATKADKTYVDTELDKKANADLDNLTETGKNAIKEVMKDDLATKADKSYVDTELSKKADADSVYTKAETDTKIENAVAGFNTAMAGKADKTYVDAELAKKVGTAEFNTVKEQVESNATAITGKADKTYVDTELSKKADKTDVTQLSSKVTANETAIEGLKNATGIDTDAYAEKLGVGEVADGNTGLVTGGTVYQAVSELKESVGVGLVTVSDGTVTVAKDSEATKVNFSGKDGARTLTGIMTDASDVYSAANVGYVEAQAKALESGMNAMNAKLTDDIKNTGAVAAALAGLHHLDYDPDNKLDVAAAVGHYRGKNAGALGVFYQPNENVMISAGATLGADDNAYNAGVSFKVGKGSAYGSTSKAAMAAEIRQLKANNESQATEIREQASEIKELKAQMALLMEKMELSEKVEKSIAK